MKQCKDCKHVDLYTEYNPFTDDRARVWCDRKNKEVDRYKMIDICMFWAPKILLLTLALLLSGCSTSKFALNLTDRTLITERWNSDLDIGKIEYIEKANGDTHIIITSYKLAEAEIPLEWMRLAAAMYGGDVVGAAAALKGVKP